MKRSTVCENFLKANEVNCCSLISDHDEGSFNNNGCDCCNGLANTTYDCNGYMVSELGNTRISLIKEINVYHLKSTNILGAGQVWEILETYKDAIKKFRQLRTIQKGNYTLINYEAKT